MAEEHAVGPRNGLVAKVHHPPPGVAVGEGRELSLDGARAGAGGPTHHQPAQCEPRKLLFERAVYPSGLGHGLSPARRIQVHAAHLESVARARVLASSVWTSAESLGTVNWGREDRAKAQIRPGEAKATVGQPPTRKGSVTAPPRSHPTGAFQPWSAIVVRIDS